MKLLIDADASPVIDVAIPIAAEYNLPVVLVKSYAHFSHQQKGEHVEVVYVDHGTDAADFRLMQLAKQGDIIITQDYGLASLALAKECVVLHHKGFQYTDENIDQLLLTRYLSQKARNSGKRTKGPKPFTREDANKFALLLRKTISDLIE